MLKPLKDGHINVYSNKSSKPEFFFHRMIEDKAVITISADTYF